MKKLKKLIKFLKLRESTISMILGGLVVVVVSVLIFNYFRNLRQPPTPEEFKEVNTQEVEKIEMENLPTVYTVKEGDNLWKIAETIYGSSYNWVNISQENKLTNPNLLLVGQQLTIPKVEVIKLKTTDSITQLNQTITEESYTVLKGDHLWGIAVRAYGDGYQWVKIARENNLENPNLIHPGNILKLPR